MTSHRPDRDQQKAKFVYFARGLHSGLIKIGCSWSPTERAGSLELEHGEPVRMLFTEPGSFQKERGYHVRFLDHRADRGAEWFYESGTLHAFLKRKGHAGTPVVYKKQVIEKVVERPGAAVLVFPELAGKAEPIEPRMVGYARVSTEDQNLDMQLTMLRQAGVRDDDLFMDKLSAVSAKRPYFNLMLKHVYGRTRSSLAKTLQPSWVSRGRRLRCTVSTVSACSWRLKMPAKRPRSAQEAGLRDARSMAPMGGRSRGRTAMTATQKAAALVRDWEKDFPDAKRLSDQAAGELIRRIATAMIAERK